LDGRLGVGLVAANPIMQVGSGAAATVPLTQPVGNFVGDGGRVTTAVAADRKT
jgi:hypothetical protein